MLILDEVMCGMGRTGTLHACAQEGIAPDLMTIAKGLGGGYQPIGAVLLSKRIFDAFANGSGAFQHGHTTMGHPMAAAAALAVQEVIRRDDLLANVVAMGDLLQRRLEARFGQHAHVGDIGGRGLFRALELVADRASKAPFDPAERLHARVKREAMARGLLVYPMGGTIDGARGRPCAAGAAVHRERAASRGDRRSPRRGGRCGARVEVEFGSAIQPTPTHRGQSGLLD